MISSVSASLMLVLALAGCASGTTLRATDEGDGTLNDPVSLAPSPTGDSQPAPPPGAEPEPQTGAQPEPTPAQGYAPYESERTLDVRRLGQWTRTGISEARRLVIRDANAWDQFWSELGVGSRPDVDFTRDAVIAVAAGQRPTGGYEIIVDGVTHANGQLKVHVLERTPGPNCMTAASLTQPVDVVVVPAADARSWNFVERKEIRACR